LSFHHESLTWCKHHKHEVDYDLVHFCKQIPSTGCASCSECTTLEITMTGKFIKFETPSQDSTHYMNHPFLDEIRECINQPLRDFSVSTKRKEEKSE